MRQGQSAIVESDTAGRSAWLIAYRALSDAAAKGAFFLVTIVAARRLAPEAFGLFALGTTLGWMAAVAADFGIQLHVARAVAMRPTEAGRVLRVWLGVRLWTAAVVFVVVGAGLMVAGVPFVSSAVLLLFVASYLLTGLAELLYYLFRGLARSDLESTITLAQRGGMLVLAILALWWAPSVAWLAAAMLAAAAVTFWLTHGIATTLVSAGPFPAGARTAAVQADLPRIVPIGAGILLSALYFRVDAILVDAWLGSSALGLYNAAFRLIDALRLLPAAVLAVMLPHIFRATSRTPLITIAATMTAGAAVVSGALAAAAGWLVPALFGARFGDAVPAFRILLLAFPLMSLNYALTHQLIGWEGHRTYAAACGAALAFNVALNARLIPIGGIEGAAWATVWTEALMTLVSGIALARIDPAASPAAAAGRVAVS